MSDITDYFSNFDDPYGVQDSVEAGGRTGRRADLARQWKFLYDSGDTVGLARFKKKYPTVVKSIQKGDYRYLGIFEGAGRPGFGQPKPTRFGDIPLSTRASVDKLPPIGAAQVRPGLGALLQPGKFLNATVYGAILSGIYQQLPEKLKAPALAAARGLLGVVTGNFPLIQQSFGEITGQIPGRVLPLAIPRRAELKPVKVTARRKLVPVPAGIGDPLEDPRSGPYRPYRAPGAPASYLVPGAVTVPAARNVSASRSSAPVGSRVTGTAARPGVSRPTSRPAGVPTRNPLLSTFFSKFGAALPKLTVEYFRSRRSSPQFRVSPFAISPEQPAGQPAPLPLTELETESATCTCPKKKPAQDRKPRTLCYSGNYIERTFGLTKTRGRRIPCRQSKKKLR